jgi:hypothetical protein
MAVDAKFSICQDSNCQAINFTETTGVYEVTSNPTGWGAPNEETTDATSATLSIIGPDGTTYPTVDLFATGNFPKSDSTSVSIPATTLSSAMTTFADGLWEMVYAVTTSTATYTETRTFFFDCSINNCVCKLIAAVDIDDCTCDPDKMNEALKAKAFLDSMGYAAGCGNLAGANEILQSLTRLCGCN